MKNLLLYSVLALLLAPGVVATETPTDTTNSHEVSQPSTCSDALASPELATADGFAAWLDRIGAKALQPDAAERMAAPACPDLVPCSRPCVEGDGPCFLKPLGSSKCCFPEGGCLECEGEAEIFVIKCPCLGAGCPRQSVALECG